MGESVFEWGCYMKKHDIERGLRKRDAKTYEYLIDTYGRLVWTVAAGILNQTASREDIEECVSDVFISLWEKPEQFNPSRGEINTFLCLLAKSRAIDRLRKQSKIAYVSIEEVAVTEDDDFLDQLIEKEIIISVNDYMRGLEEPDCEILRLKFIYELKPALIASKLELPISEVYKRIRNGKNELAKLVKKGGL